MKRVLAMLISCGGLLLTPGCGSSSRSPAGSTGAAPAATSTAKGRGLKVSTTPKFASPPASAPVRSGVVQIAYRNITIAPDTIKVKVGSTIVWTNYDSVQHNVTSKGGPVRFASANFGQGMSFRVTVTKPGVIHYVCTLHPVSMNGTIEVIS